MFLVAPVVLHTQLQNPSTTCWGGRTRVLGGRIGARHTWSKHPPRCAAAQEPNTQSSGNDSNTQTQQQPPSQQQTFAKIIQFARLASPYIEGHRGRTFVVLIPGEVVANPTIITSILDDLLLLQGIGVRLVLVVGSSAQIDKSLHARGIMPRFVSGYRVTDQTTLQAALESCSANVTLVQARLSKVCMLFVGWFLGVLW